MSEVTWTCADFFCGAGGMVGGSVNVTTAEMQRDAAPLALFGGEPFKPPA